MPGLTDDLIEQFRVQQDRNSHPNQEIRKRISYKEQKLAAISYATTIWKTNENCSMELITKYKAAADFGITTAMLRDWLKFRTAIEAMHGGVRKHGIYTVCQEPILEECLVELLIPASQAGRKITHR